MASSYPCILLLKGQQKTLSRHYLRHLRASYRSATIFSPTLSLILTTGSLLPCWFYLWTHPEILAERWCHEVDCHLGFGFDTFSRVFIFEARSNSNLLTVKRIFFLLGLVLRVAALHFRIAGHRVFLQSSVLTEKEGQPKHVYMLGLPFRFSVAVSCLMGE